MLFGLFAKPRRRKQAPSVPPFGPEWFISGGPSVSGEFVTADRAMREATVAACVRILAESVAQLPMKVFQGESANTVERGPLVDLLRYPNAWQDSFQFREYMMVCLCLRGNFYALMTRDRNGNVRELLPLHPESVSARLKDWEPVYAYTDALGGSAECGPDRMLHVRGESLDGIVGFSPIAYHRNTIGLSLATEAHGGRIFRNGARPGGILTHPSKLSDEALEHLRQSWAASHGGENSGGTAILEEGMDFKPVAMTNEDAQYLETRKFQRGLICGIFRVPPHMVADLEKATFSNIEHQSIEFAKYSILPWAVRIETALMRHLLTREQRDAGLRVRLVLDGLERADIKTRYESYSIAVQNGILSPNECRRLENRHPREGGDVFLQPLNMTDGSGTGEDESDAKSWNVPQPADSRLMRRGFFDVDGFLRERKGDAVVTTETAPPGAPMGADAASGKPTAGGVEAGGAVQCKAASDEDEDDDEHDHDDWADGEWSEESADLNRIMQELRPKLERMYREIVAKEIAEIRTLADRYFPEGKQRRKSAETEFISALQMMYGRLRKSMEKDGEHIFADLAAETTTMAAKQLDVNKEKLLRDLLATVPDYARIDAERYAEGAVRQFVKLMETKADPREAIFKRLEEWNVGRAKKISKRQAVYGANWYARESYRKAGVQQLRWVANGGKTCGFCAKLHNVTVGIKGNFVDKGGEVRGGDGRPWHAKRAKQHPPLHIGCVCAIVPVFEPFAGIDCGVPISTREALEGSNPNYKKKDGYDKVCPAAVFVYEMRRRGYPVTTASLVNNDALEKLRHDPWSIWTRPDGEESLAIKRTECTRPEQLHEFLRKNIEPGDRYVLKFFKGIDLTGEGRLGHMVHIFRDREGLKWRDALTGNEYKEGTDEWLKRLGEVQYALGEQELLRVNNLRFNHRIARAIIQEGK